MPVAVSSPSAPPTQSVSLATGTAAGSTNGSAVAPRHGRYRHIWLVTGPAGCGKSTVAKHLASTLNLHYVEGDEFHPHENIEKMSAGIPLSDADRWDWLTALRDESMRQIGAGHDQVVLTCSALKRKYRDVIRVAPYFHSGVGLHFIYLHASQDVLLQRVAGRADHYMKPSMVQSQLDILEPPQADEADVLSVDVARPLDAVNADVLGRVMAIVRREAAASEE